MRDRIINKGDICILLNVRIRRDSILSLLLSLLIMYALPSCFLARRKMSVTDVCIKWSITIAI